MHNLRPRPGDIPGVQNILTMSAGTYPGHPDPTTKSGRAEIPILLLTVDLTGRDDIVSLMKRDVELEAKAALLTLVDLADEGSYCFVFTLLLGEKLDPLPIAGFADPDTVGMLARATMLWIAPDFAAALKGARGLIFAPNDPIQWSCYLLPEKPGDLVPDCPPPRAPVQAEPQWNSHRKSWLVQDPETLTWWEYRPDGWHILDALAGAA